MFYKGSDGAVLLNGEELAHTKEWTLTLNRAPLSRTTTDQSTNRYVGGRKAGRGNLRLLAKNESPTTNAQALLNQLLNPSGELMLKLVISPTEDFRFTAVLSRAGANLAVRNPLNCEFEFVPTGRIERVTM